jgi:tetratricopeptide (TPR) repeat protein
MKLHIIYIYTLAALLLVGCNASRHRDMLAQLEELERQNVADSLMTNDSLAQALTEYFDRHGTPNEQLRAHYILGRTYADLGEAPAAIEAYFDAAERADTTASDCDWAKLSRVHAQSALLYHRLVQPRSQLQELSLAIVCATKAGDSLMAIECFSQKADAYRQLHVNDSVIYFRERASQMYTSIGQQKRSAIAISIAVPSLLDIGNVEKAKKYMDIYESSSGLFDDSGNIAKGREIYYYVKGRYYLAISKVDSAEFMFRLLARKGYSLNHKIASCKGLQEVFSRKGVADSIAKYAELGYQLNDSAYSLSEMENIQRLKASYNYTRSKLQAEKKENEASRMRQLFLLVSSLSLVALLSLLMGIVVYRKKKQMQLVRYQQLLSNLEQAQSHLQELLSDEQQLSASTIRKLTDEVAYWKHKVEENRKVTLVSKSSINKTLEKSNIVARMRQMLEKNPPETVSVSDIKELKNLINEVIPTFYDSLNTPDCVLRPVEYEVCMLIRVFFSPAEICKLMDRSDAYISNLRRRILKKRYGIEGAPKELDALILNIL